MLKTEKSCCLWPHCSRTFSRGKEPKRNRIRPWRAHRAPLLICCSGQKHPYEKRAIPPRKKKSNLRSTRTRTKPHYLKPLPATKPHSMNQQTIQPHLPTNVLSGSGSTKKTRSVKNSTRLTRERKNSSSRRLRAG